jgi:hypothetical protein
MFVGSNAKKRPGSQQRTTAQIDAGVSEMCLLEEWKKDCQEQDGCLQVINNHLGFLVDSLQNPDLRQTGMDTAPLLLSSFLSLSFGNINITHCRTK